jgi:SPX domain protein involved in polyphosphate accumulation
MAEIFQREEEKYLLDGERMRAVKNEFEKHLQVDKYGLQTVVSVYFDNDWNGSVINSMSKPVYKEKLRLRSYGTPTEDTAVYLELKKKYKGTVYKRRSEMSMRDAENYLEGKKQPDTQIMREIDYVRKLYGLKPRIYIAYDRFAWTDGGGIRVTIDTNIRYRTENPDLRVSGGTKAFSDGEYYLMEIKVNGGMPLWMAKTLDGNGIYPTSFSKYGNIYRKYIS